MALITRRNFARQMAFAAALCGNPLWAIGESHGPFGPDKQSSAPPDPQTIRKLASQIVGQVITPEAADYDAARLVFNRAFDRRPAVIVRCGKLLDVGALDLLIFQHLPGGGVPEARAGSSGLQCDGGVVISIFRHETYQRDITRSGGVEAWALRAPDLTLLTSVFLSG